MQLPPFDPTARGYGWDRYKAFHVKHIDQDGLEIVQFDTGELVVRVHKSNPHPDARKAYPAFGFTITTTKDEDCPSLVLDDGTPVPRAWFGRTMQTLLVDTATQQVVGLGASYTLPYKSFMQPYQHHVDFAAHHGVPERFAKLGRGFAWFGGVGRRPVSNRPIHLDRPIEYAPEAWATARAYRMAAIAWMGIQGKSLDSRPYGTTPMQVLDVLKFGTFGEMPDAAKENLARGGLTAGMTTVVVPHLRVAPRPAAADDGTTMSCTTSGAAGQVLRDAA
jgi:hypothetical protein